MPQEGCILRKGRAAVGPGQSEHSRALGFEIVGPWAVGVQSLGPRFLKESGRQNSFEEDGVV